MKSWAARLVLASLCLGFTCLAATVAWSQAGGSRPPASVTPIGKILAVKGPVTVEHSSAVVVQTGLPAGDPAQAKIDDPVYQGDIVKTGPNGSASIVFADTTSFNISQNARMELNEFVYNPKSHSNSTVFNLTKGAFTFIAGKVAHTGSMKVETPVATMGIRGTAPHVEILEDGSVKFSTLIEENKNKHVTVTPNKRAARDRASTDLAVIDKGGKDLSGAYKICRNC